MSIKRESYGKTNDGTEVQIFTLENSKGASTKITNYGGIIVSLQTPDRDGKFEDIVHGFDSLDGYLKGHPYFGAIIGRYGNRIGGARFTLDGREYTLAATNGTCSLHGGVEGFDKKVWKAKEENTPEGPGLSLSYLSPDGEEGYPGNLSVQVDYTLTEQNEIKIDYTAMTDRTTVLNLTNHSYFNLSPAQSPTILDHVVTTNSDTFTETDEGMIPTGKLTDVTGTPMDFRSPHPIGERVNADYEALHLGKGYDHNWVINGEAGTLRFAARASSPASGRVLEVRTTAPSMQMYIGNFLDGTLKGKGGRVYAYRSGFCFETQHFPDSPNHPEFPTTVLRPGEIYRSTTVYSW